MMLSSSASFAPPKLLMSNEKLTKLMRKIIPTPTSLQKEADHAIAGLKEYSQGDEHMPNPNPTSATQTTQLPLRSSTDIQGNILAGFSKDHQTIIFLKFPNAGSGQKWLKDLLPSIATTKAVADFNDKFSAARRQNGGKDPQNLKATWVGLGLTFNGLTMLAPNLKKDLPSGSAFVDGAASRASILGDADPKTWTIGRDDQQVHALLTVAADDEYDLDNKLNDMRTLAKNHGLAIISEQRGDTLPGDLKGHEHFGFKDGISQPGVRDFNRPDPTNKFDSEHPGAALIFAGEFVLGYPLQDALNEDNSQPSQSRPAPPIPAWMKDGSFQVFRRLNQDVFGFGVKAIDLGDTLQTSHPSMMIPQDLVKAKLVGRWPSGAPLDLAPTTDTGNDSNNFRFIDKDAHGNVIKDSSGNPVRDPQGLRCPRFAHIRKVYPRDDAGFADGQHRILRRGIPFGKPFNPSAGPGSGENDERGLLFMAFMSSIENQFEFLQSLWVNSPFFPDGDAGHDPIIAAVSDNDALTFHHADGSGSALTKSCGFPQFVHTTGAVYAFAPSLTTLNNLANGKL